jgi:hypothetical protein
MFQANYQYTPLKEYAAMRSNRTTNDTNNINGYLRKYLKFHFPKLKSEEKKSSKSIKCTF